MIRIVDDIEEKQQKSVFQINGQKMMEILL